MKLEINFIFQHKSFYTEFWEKLFSFNFSVHASVLISLSLPVKGSQCYIIPKTKKKNLREPATKD